MKAISIVLLLCIAGQMLAAPVAMETGFRERISRLLLQQKQVDNTGEGTPVAADAWTPEESFLAGEKAGRAMPSSMWFFGSFLCGLGLGVVGNEMVHFTDESDKDIEIPAGAAVVGGVSTLVLTILATEDSPNLIPGEADESRYREGFTRGSRSKNRRGAMSGGLLGTVVAAVVVMVAQHQDRSSN